ncbi:MAG: beta-galactosidase [Armatimonadota bacterium]
MFTCSHATAANKASVVKTPSGPVLMINGKPTAPALLQVGIMGDNTLAQKQVKWAAQNGINIVSPTLWGIPWTKDGETPSLAGTDIEYWMDSIVKANPNALLIPRFPVDQPPAWWIEQHPDEIMQYQDGTKGLASIHSKIWRKAAAKQIANLIGILEKKYPNNMIGYHVCGQNSAEWFYEGFWDGKYEGFEPPARDGFRIYLKNKYKSDKALQTAWADKSVTLNTAPVPTFAERTASSKGSFRDPKLHRKALDFDVYQNLAMADCVSEMCKAVKDAVPDRLALAFYGYTLELSGSARSGHIALGKLLESPYVDGICAPYSYGDREPGGSGRFMGVVDSMLEHGKIFFTEDDTRTFLTDPAASPGRCADLRQTEGVMTRNFAHILTRGAGLWWMEPVGNGMYASEELLKHNGRLTDIYQSSLPTHTRYAPEVAVIVDELSGLAANPFMDGVGSEGVNVSLMVRSRYSLYRMGAPLGTYLLDDLLAGKVPPAKMYIIMNAFQLSNAQLSALRKRVCHSNNTVVWMYAPGIINGNTITPENVSKVTGINLRQITGVDGNIVIEGSGEKFDAVQSGLSPMYAVDDQRATPIARYAGSANAVAVAQTKMQGYTSVYSGALQLPTSVLRDIANDAGVHIYNDQDNIIMAGNGFVALHATSNGRKIVRLPSLSKVQDALTGQSLGTSRTLSFDMQVGDSMLLRVQPDNNK